MAIKVQTQTKITDARTFQDLSTWSGTYGNFQPNVTAVNTDIDIRNAMNSKTLSANVTFTVSNIAAGRTSLLLMDISANGYTPTFPSSVKWVEDTEPTWTSARYWMVGLTAWDGSTVRATATAWGS